MGQIQPQLKWTLAAQVTAALDEYVYSSNKQMSWFEDTDNF